MDEEYYQGFINEYAEGNNYMVEKTFDLLKKRINEAKKKFNHEKELIKLLDDLWKFIEEY